LLLLLESGGCILKTFRFSLLRSKFHSSCLDGKIILFHHCLCFCFCFFDQIYVRCVVSCLDSSFLRICFNGGGQMTKGTSVTIGTIDAGTFGGTLLVIVTSTMSTAQLCLFKLVARHCIACIAAKSIFACAHGRQFVLRWFL
jgi:hypothetical protein